MCALTVVCFACSVGDGSAPGSEDQGGASESGLGEGGSLGESGGVPDEGPLDGGGSEEGWPEDGGSEEGSSEEGSSEEGGEDPHPDDPPSCSGIEVRNDHEVLLCNDLDDPIIARYELPAGDPPASGWPGIVLLHGSGGLFQGDDDMCSEMPEAQFTIWSELLTERDYAVLMPASFYSRGFCEWNDQPNGPDKIKKKERLILRALDAVAAANYLCHDPKVDCDRLAMLGFSNGGSTVLLTMNQDLTDAKDSRLHDLDPPDLVGAIAYYPGCGLQGQITHSLNDKKLGDFYYPRGPIVVQHAEKDDLLDDCEEVRDPQVELVAAALGVDEDMFDLQVYEDADHSFDSPDEDDPDDVAAREAARKLSLEMLESWFF